MSSTSATTKVKPAQVSILGSVAVYYESNRGTMYFSKEFNGLTKFLLAGTPNVIKSLPDAKKIPETTVRENELLSLYKAGKLVLFADIGLLVSRDNINSFINEHYTNFKNNVADLTNVPVDSLNRFGFGNLSDGSSIDGVNLETSPFGRSNSFEQQGRSAAGGGNVSSPAFVLSKDNLTTAMSIYYLMNSKHAACEIIGRRSAVSLSTSDPSSRTATQCRNVRMAVDERFAIKAESASGVEGHLIDNRMDDDVYKCRVVDFRQRTTNNRIRLTFPNTICSVDANAPMTHARNGFYVSAGRKSMSFARLVRTVYPSAPSVLSEDEMLFLSIVFCGQVVVPVDGSRIGERYYVHCKPGVSVDTVEPSMAGVYYMMAYLRTHASSIYNKLMAESDFLTPNARRAIEIMIQQGEMPIDKLQKVVSQKRGTGGATAASRTTKAVGKTREFSNLQATMLDQMEKNHNVSASHATSRKHSNTVSPMPNLGMSGFLPALATAAARSPPSSHPTSPVRSHQTSPTRGFGSAFPEADGFASADINSAFDGNMSNFGVPTTAFGEQPGGDAMFASALNARASLSGSRPGSRAGSHSASPVRGNTSNNAFGSSSANTSFGRKSSPIREVMPESFPNM